METIYFSNTTQSQIYPEQSDNTVHLSYMEALVSEAPQAPVAPRKFSVIGAGVVGVMVAHKLAEAGHDVTVFSQQGMPSQNSDSTSSVAAGQFLPWLPEGHSEGVMGDLDLMSIVGTSREFYANLAKDSHTTGVMSVSNVELLKEGSPWPQDLPEAMQVEVKKLKHPVMVEEPNGDETAFDEVYTFDTFSINARKTLAHLAKQAQAKGVNFVKQTIKPEDLEQLEGVIVNAGGIGAKTFDPTNAVKEFKGHSFVIRPEEGHMLKQAISVDDLIMIPREDGTIVCGALYIADPENPIPEEKEAEELFKRLSTLARNTTDLVSGMTPDLLEKCEVLMHSAGYRVEAKGGGIRVAPDEANERLLHAYGFAGIGWSVGPHFASVIADAANELHNKTKEN